ncbi:hypothetical protein NC992_06995 [Leptolyngbya subtilissima DQ-A4]|uniref:Uncharacterized protein n=1 Tax=Leptolyngbya subtilissima DQ-A4 TaxID=2933933 RepID=A0ABV0K1M5_9CYAN|nr:hypothetical protein [Nodosilinea sp. FACHB-141]
MMNNEFRILIEAYTQASNDGDTATAETLMKELDGIVVLSQHDRLNTEKNKGWTVGSTRRDSLPQSRQPRQRGIKDEH